jgi:hypothetical protein
LQQIKLPLCAAEKHQVHPHLRCLVRGPERTDQTFRVLLILLQDLRPARLRW